MSGSRVAFRPHFPWTVAIATTNGDLIIRHLPISRHCLASEHIIYHTNSIFESLQWSESGDFLIADECIFEFRHDDDCTFVRCEHLRPPRCHNGTIAVSINDQDMLTTSSSSDVCFNQLPPQSKEKISALCVAAQMCSSFDDTEIQKMMNLLICMELNAERHLYWY